MNKQAYSHSYGVPARRACQCAVLSVIALLTCISLSGCARYPASASGTTPALLFVTTTVEGQINPAYYYFIALQASPDNNVQDADPQLGPFAVVQSSPGTSGWGNGWGTGRITDYVEYHGGQATQYSVNCADNTTCPSNVALGGVPIGPPYQASVSADGHTLVVAVNLSTIGTNAGTTNTAGAVPGGVVVNVISTDHIEQNPTAPPKPVDSLDISGTLLTGLPQLDLHQSKTIDLRPTSPVLFQSGTVNTPDLHLTDVQMEVRLP